ncbi:MAG: sugar ABC transporter substrate-binding protein [Spirochaetaceae bacterium]|nr:MAG: sugar ABC transporter substrate-binding protein [Spirochaetaceae bacterium]
MKRNLFLVMLLIAVVFVAWTGGQKGPAAGKEMAVDFWHHESPTHRVDAFQKVIDDFQKSNPNVTVTQHVVPWGDSITKVMASLAANNPPDFIFSYPIHTITLYKTNSIIPLDELVKEIDQKHSYIPGQAELLRYKGNYWGAPVFTMMYALSYRPSFLEKYAAAKNPPKTWDEFLEIAKKCTVDTNGDGKTDLYGIALGAAKNLFTSQQIYTLMINARSFIYDKEGKVIFNSPETVRALTFYKQLSQYAPPGITAWAWGEQELSFASDQTAMMMGNGMPDARRFMEMKNYDIAATEQPYPPDGVRGGVSYVNNVCIFKKAQDRGSYETVRQFINFMMLPENNTPLANMEPFGFLPVTKTAMEYEGYWKDPMIAQLADSGRAVLNSIQYGQLMGLEHGGWVNLAIAEVDGSSILAEIAQKVYVNDLSPKEAAKWGHEQIQKITDAAK